MPCDYSLFYWYDEAKEYDSIFNQLGLDLELGANVLVQNVLQSRIGDVRIRIIGGQVLVGDELFIKACALYIRNMDVRFNSRLKAAQAISNRLKVEFPPSPDDQNRVYR